ncbi:bacteriophage protein [Neoasaia chiangmaiensis NBRC 101099]|uniref:Uncharacterized protein n=1 Tax=Neoasaia chiangmaiensis TaxID=320497 RepID=A0A1U9KR99_9PROT|nr:phage GP46 family protein [Neoasaia chiangmaiensis]AQS88277.1 hypothetical protein A0U93_10355 [Neoasaia chiangmaiensis]GBR39671.1 bacteriophage protein [Neoasaia chiangmaiensis NBRC 101099]GEN14689.1 hypothetical protein NCH01_11200 [Neoasaia chiangmaiensis]
MDIAITWNVRECRGDWSIVSSDLALDNPLRTAVMVSLFTDRVAPEQPSSGDQAVGIAAPGNAANSGMSDRRGWWGDAYADLPIGSRLWQLRRAIKSGDHAIPLELEAICREALQWLIDDGVASGVTVNAAWSALSSSTVEFAVTIAEPTGSTQTFYYSWAWEGLT